MNYEYEVVEINVSLLAQGMSASQKPDNVSGEIKVYGVAVKTERARRIVTLGRNNPTPLEFSTRDVAEDFCTLLNMARRERLQGRPQESTEDMVFHMMPNV